jgi:predicted amidophosphoribosyltransferase
LVCRNICERIRYKRISFGAGGNYFDGKKYCRRCEVYLYHNGLFCPCCGMQLRLTPSSRECKEILRKRKASRIEKVA